MDSSAERRQRKDLIGVARPFLTTPPEAGGVLSVMLVNVISCSLALSPFPSRHQPISFFEGCRRDQPHISSGFDLGPGRVTRSSFDPHFFASLIIYTSAYAHDARPAENRSAPLTRAGLGGHQAYLGRRRQDVLH